MATYNGGKYIKEQMDSILAQEFKENLDVEMEVIVSDDGSTDDTLRTVEAYHDPRIRIVHHTEHKHHHYLNATREVTANFDFAIRQAKGDYIFLSDQDDVWYPWKVDKQLTQLRQVGGVNCCAFDMGDETLKPTGRIQYEKDKRFLQLRNLSTAWGFTMAFDRNELNYLLPIPSFTMGHDTFIKYNALCRKRLSYIDTPCAIHRWDGHNVSSFGKNNLMPPLPIRLLIRLNTYATVIWRAITI